jgi:hypothetical protein
MALNILQKVSVPEMSLLIVFIIYVIFPISTPEVFVPIIDSPIGYVSVFIITVGLFVYTTPLLGIVYIFVAYELIRRSSLRSIQNKPKSTQDVIRTRYMPTHLPKPIPEPTVKEIEMALMNPEREPTLEEEIVQLRAPIGKSDNVKYTESSFKPVATDVLGASMY